MRTVICTADWQAIASFANAFAVLAAGPNVTDFLQKARATVWKDYETPDAISGEIDAAYESLRKSLARIAPIPRELE